MGTAFTYQVPAAGGTAPYTFSLNGGSLPGGLSMNSSGFISGTPTASFPSYYIGLKLVDNSASQLTSFGSLNLTINPAFISITMRSIPFRMLS